jgi:hypothetical protein
MPIQKYADVPIFYQHIVLFGTLSLVSKLRGSFEATRQLILKKELKKKVNKF